MRFDLVPRSLPRSGRTDDDEDPLLVSLAGGEEVNRAVVSGVIISEPVRDTDRAGDPITVLMVSFGAPDEGARDTSTCCEVEVTDSIADRHRRRLCVGRRVWVAGQLTGTGLWATSLGVP
jgi:hypothetical protein